MLSPTDLILPPLLAYVVAAMLGIGFALLRARRSASGWVVLDIVVLLFVLIPVPVLANAFAAITPADTNRLVPWMLAAALTAAPLAYLPARIALTRTSEDYRDTARLLGLGPVGRFFRIDLPLTWPAIGRGKLLALTRIVGEWLLVIGALDRLTVLTGAVAILSLVAAIAIGFSLPRPAPATR
jgi:ABC-type spermidine/putrescine transport system permease subunit II